MAQSDGTGTHKLASIGRPELGNFVQSVSKDIIRFDENNWQLWQMSSDGSNLHRMLLGPRAVGGACCGRWTPDGRFFVFLGGISGFSDFRRTGQIWALDERRGVDSQPPPDPIQLTSGPLSWNKPILSKDGRTIYAAGSTVQGELSRFDSRAKEFRPFLGGISAQGITFSKDGKSVAYVSFPDGILWKANRDGSNPMQLSEPSMDVFMPRWSPDGTQILFSDTSIGSEIYLISAQGGNPHKLLPEGSGKQGDPDWSPDGHKVVFGASFGGHDAKSTIRIFDLDSQKLTTVPGSTGMCDPRWSPDGRFISASSSDPYTVNIFEIKTQRWTAYPIKTGLTFPEWSRNSQFIYFLTTLSEDPALYRLCVKTGQIEKVVGLKNWHISGWFDQWTGLDPTDAPLLLRDIGSSDIYALTLDQ